MFGEHAGLVDLGIEQHRDDTFHHFIELLMARTRSVGREISPLLAFGQSGAMAMIGWTTSHKVRTIRAVVVKLLQLALLFLEVFDQLPVLGCGGLFLPVELWQQEHSFEIENAPHQVGKRVEIGQRRLAIERVDDFQRDIDGQALTVILLQQALPRKQSGDLSCNAARAPSDWCGPVR